MHEIYANVVAFSRAVLRFRWTVLLVAFVISTLGWATVYQLSDKYVAEARIFVDSNQILGPLMQGLTVQPNVNERIGLMTKTLLNRPNLEKLAGMSGLDLLAETPYEKERQLDQLGWDVRLSGSQGNASLYTVSYTHEDPDVARRVVQSLITIFVEGSRGEERQDSVVAQRFLDQQIVDYEARLLAAERRLSDFKRENAGKMPGQAGGYYQRLDAATSEARGARLELREARTRRDALRRQLADERPTIPEGGLGAPSPLDAALFARRDELSTLLVRYTERHPRVSQLRESIASLEGRKARESRDGSAEPRYSLVPSPIYQELRSLLAEAEARVAELEVRVSDYAEQVAELDATVETIPKIEAELQELDRDYLIVKEQYETLLARRESARLSERVEQNADDVKFRVIDPPFVPSRPSSPNKKLLSLGVFAAALGAGAALAFALSLLRPIFYDAEAVSARTGRPVIGTVSHQTGLDSRLPKVLEWGAFVTLILLLGAIFAVVMAIHLGVLERAQLEPLLESRLGLLVELVSDAASMLLEQANRVLGRSGE